METVLEIVREQNEQLAAKLTIVDVGTGSGCVALALANELPFADLHATDISTRRAGNCQGECGAATAGRPSEIPALRRIEATVAQTDSGPSTRTAVLAQDDKAEFHDLDFVVSNPPYVAYSEADKVQRSVKEFEPQTAVFAGEHGLDIIVRLIAEAHAVLKSGGWLAMEIGYSMRDQVVELLSPTLWEEVRVVPDLQGIPRVIAARKVHPAEDKKASPSTAEAVSG